MEIELQHELAVAVEAARAAAREIMIFYRLEIIAEEKIGVDNFAEPVTAADREASRIIVEHLSAAFPDDAILSEEEKEDAEIRLSKSRVWMIDPIDGTKGFIDRNGDFAVQIGLVENGAPVLGVVLLPAEDVLYYAVKNQGCYVVKKDGKPERLQVSDKTDFADINVASSRNHLTDRMKHVYDALKIKNVSNRGSVGLKVGLIAERISDLYINISPRTKFWDTCAPQIILEEAGGKLTDIFGLPCRYDVRDVQNHNGVLASNGAVHESVSAKLKPLLNDFGRLRLKAKTS